MYSLSFYFYFFPADAEVPVPNKQSQFAELLLRGISARHEHNVANKSSILQRHVIGVQRVQSVNLYPETKYRGSESQPTSTARRQ